MHTIMVPAYVFDRVVGAIERELPNATVQQFPLEFHADADAITEHFIMPKSHLFPFPKP